MVGEVDRGRSSHFNSLLDRCGKTDRIDPKEEFPTAPAPTRRSLFKLAAAGGMAFVAGSHRADAAPLAAYRAPAVRVLGMGQSLMRLWRVPGLRVWETFVARLRQCGETRPISMINTAVDGSAALKRYVSAAAPRTYWWDENTGRPGPLLLDTLAVLRASSIQPTCLVWSQGGQDSMAYRGKTDADAAEFIRLESLAMIRIFDTIKSAIGNVPVFVEGLHARSGHTDWWGMTQFHAAQALVVGRPGIYWAARPGPDLSTTDGTHYDATGGAWIGRETADAIRGRV